MTDFIRWFLTLLIIKVPRFLEELSVKHNYVSQQWIDEHKKEDLGI